jgi:hypothetical protein
MIHVRLFLSFSGQCPLFLSRSRARARGKRLRWWRWGHLSLNPIIQEFRCEHRTSNETRPQLWPCSFLWVMHGFSVTCCVTACVILTRCVLGDVLTTPYTFCGPDLPNGLRISSGSFTIGSSSPAHTCLLKADADANTPRIDMDYVDFNDVEVSLTPIYFSSQ